VLIAPDLSHLERKDCRAIELIGHIRPDDGIAMIPDYVAENESQLERVLTGIEIPAYETYFVYPPALKNSKRVGVFRDFLVGKAREWSF